MHNSSVLDKRVTGDVHLLSPDCEKHFNQIHHDDGSINLLYRVHFDGRLLDIQV